MSVSIRQLPYEWLDDPLPRRCDPYKSYGALYYQGNVIYSYGSHFPIARREGKRVAIRPYDDCPSATTRKHYTNVLRAAREKAESVLEVPDIEPTPGSAEELILAAALGSLAFTRTR